MFYEVAKIVPEGTCGDAQIIHTRTNRTVRVPTVHDHPPVRPGIYCSLFIDGDLYMSEAPIEWVASRPVMENARGTVLIAGLGIGMILPSILSNPLVNEVIVVERNQNVIDLVLPHYQHPKLSVVLSDINDFKPNIKFDTIFLDIWPSISVKNLPEIVALEKKAKLCWARNKDTWIHSWSKDQILEIKEHGDDTCCIRINENTIICRRKWEESYENFEAQYQP